METGIQKFIKKMLLKKYPFYLDVYVTKPSAYSKFQREDCHEVFLVLFEKDLGDTWGAREYIDELSRYMGILICEVYNEIVTEEEWEEMKRNPET